MAWVYVENNGGGNFSNAPRSNSRNSRNSRSNDGPRKHSGCKRGMFKSGKKLQGKPFVRGWNKSKADGFVTIMARPYKDTKEVKSKMGRIWHTWVAIVKRRLMADQVFPCLYEAATGRVIINDIGFVLNPNAPNGGYCGGFGRKK